jgi:hypothetical protein
MATRVATRAGFGACACTSPALPTAPRGRLRSWPPTDPEREVALSLLPRALKGGETSVCDKGYAGREFAQAFAALGALVLRPPRRSEPQTGPHLAPIRQRIESVFNTCKDLLSLERHGARTPHNLFARIATRLLALAACISLNHQLGPPAEPSLTTPPDHVASTV